MKNPEKCSCGSTDLFSGYFDREGYAVPLNLGDPTPAGVQYETHCNECGATVGSTRRARKPSAKKPDASSVSRVLARAGMRPLPSGTSRRRQGVRVHRHVLGGATVGADYDSPREAVEVADQLDEILRTAGFTTDRIADARIYVHPTRSEGSAQ